MFSSGFFNSVQGDRKYNSRQISQMFDGLITDGVIAHYGSHFAITPVSGMTINVGDGRCWFNHVWGLNDGNTTLTLDPSDVTQSRVDAIIIEVDNSDEVRNAFLKVKKGALGGAKPSMTSTATLNQHPLAYVTVAAGATSITSTAIQVVVGTSECPFSTSILESVSIDNLLAQMEGEFDEWFANIQAQLSGNVATNLQNQINVNATNIAKLESSLTTKANTADYYEKSKLILNEFIEPSSDVSSINIELNDEVRQYIMSNKTFGLIRVDVKHYSNESYDGYVYCRLRLTNNEGWFISTFATFRTAAAGIYGYIGFFETNWLSDYISTQYTSYGTTNHNVALQYYKTTNIKLDHIEVSYTGQSSRDIVRVWIKIIGYY